MGPLERTSCGSIGNAHSQMQFGLQIGLNYLVNKPHPFWWRVTAFMLEGIQEALMQPVPPEEQFRNLLSSAPFLVTAYRGDCKPFLSPGSSVTYTHFLTLH